MEPTLSSILECFDGAAAINQWASFLSAKDSLRLHAVNKQLHDILTQHEETLFASYLKRDFVEGLVLSYVAKEKNLSRKKLYRAFFTRFILPLGLGLRENEKNWVSVPWRRPGGRLGIFSSQVDENDDVSALVFVTRIWRGIDSEWQCGFLMKWGEPVNSSSERKRCGCQKLSVDDEGSIAAYDQEGGDTNKKKESEDAAGKDGGGTDEKDCNDPEPENSKAYEILNADHPPRDTSWLNPLFNSLAESHHVSLHVIDIQRCQVMSLMDKKDINKSTTGTREVNFHEGNVLASYNCYLPRLQIWGELSMSYDICCNDLHFKFADNCYEYAPKSYVCSYLRSMINENINSEVLVLPE